MHTAEASRKKVSAIFQGSAFFIAFLCLTLIFGIRYKRFVSHDPYMPLATNIEMKKKVVVGLHVSHFSTFNIAKNKFALDGTLWFSFNPNDASFENIKKFSVFNGEILHASDPIVIDHGNEKIAKFRIRTEFYTPLNYRMFPLDDHRVNLVITNRFLADDVILVSSNSNVTVDSSIYLPGWRIIDSTIRTGFKDILLERNNKQYSDIQQEAIITFDCERTDPSIMINILLTLLLMLFLAMLTFSSSEDSVLIVTVGIVALIGYRTVMQSMAPEQVSYFIFSDYLYLFTLIGIMTTLFADIITRERASSLWIKKAFIIGIYSFFVIACAVLSLM